MPVTIAKTNGTKADRPTVIEALNAVMAEVQAVGKTDRNTQQGYNFRGIDAVVNAAGPAFRRHGIVAVPLLESATYRDVQTSTGKPSRECTVQVRYRFYGPAGDYVDAVVPGESMDFGDKGTPKAMSVAYRIALLQVLTIPTHELDPDSQSYERDNAPTRPKRPAPKPAPEQLKEHAGLAQRIADAGDVETLRELWTVVTESVREGRITSAQAEELRAAVKQQRAKAAQQEQQGQVQEPAAEVAAA